MKKYILVQLSDDSSGEFALRDINGDTIFYDSKDQAWNDLNDDENPILRNQILYTDLVTVIEINLPE